jgi:hypothetical protein
MPEQPMAAGAPGRRGRAEGDRRGHGSTFRRLWRVLVSRKLAARVLAAIAGAILLNLIGSSEKAGLLGLVLGSVLGEEIDELARRTSKKKIWGLSALLALLYLRTEKASAAAAAHGVTPAASIFSGGAIASATVACAASAAIFTASAAAGGPSPIFGPGDSGGTPDVEILGFSTSEPPKLGELPRKAASPGERLRTCDPTGLWAVVRFDRRRASYLARTSVGGRVFAEYRDRARRGFANLKAHSYGSVIPDGRWTWTIRVGGRERAREDVTLVDSCP